MGSGKTSVSKRLAYLTDMPIFDTDSEIEKRIGISIEGIFLHYGADFFHKVESEVCLEIMNHSRTIISTGGAAVLNRENAEILRHNSTVFYLQASAEKIKQNIGNDVSRPRLKEDNSIKRIAEILNERQEKYISSAHYIINIDDMGINQVADSVLNFLTIYHRNP